MNTPNAIASHIGGQSPVAAAGLVRRHVAGNDDSGGDTRHVNRASDVAIPGRPSKQAASGNHGFAGSYTSPECIQALFSVKVPGKGAKANAGRFCSLQTITQRSGGYSPKAAAGLVKRLSAR